MTSTLQSWVCWRTVLKKWRTAQGASLAFSWCRWHTQHLNLVRPDLVTNCLVLKSLMQFPVGSSDAGWSYYTAYATCSNESKSCYASPDRSRDSESVFLPNLISNMAACPLTSSAALYYHNWRMFPVEPILSWTDKYSFRLEWQPTKPHCCNTSSESFGKLSASAVIITCA